MKFKKSLFIWGSLLLVIFILEYPFSSLQIEKSPYYNDYLNASSAYNSYVREKGNSPSSLEDFMPAEIRAKMASSDYPIKVEKNQDIIYHLSRNSSLNHVRIIDLITDNLSLRGLIIGKLNSQH